MQRYSVLNIFRTNEQHTSFIISVLGNKKEYYKVDKSLTEIIKMGMVYIGDKIEIKEITGDSIIFNVLENTDTDIPFKEIESDAEFLYSESKRDIKPFITPNINFLPYLCDVLPYSLIAVEQAVAEAEKNKRRCVHW